MSQHGAVKASLQRRKGLSVQEIRNKTQGTIPSTRKGKTCKLFRIAIGGNLAPPLEYDRHRY
jgi:hypothetical protein